MTGSRLMSSLNAPLKSYFAVGGLSSGRNSPGSGRIKPGGGGMPPPHHVAERARTLRRVGGMPLSSGGFMVGNERKLRTRQDERAFWAADQYAWHRDGWQYGG